MHHIIKKTLSRLAVVAAVLLPVLFVGVIIRETYVFFTEHAAVRLQCHIPSWSWEQGHVVYEVVPFAFVFFSFVFLFVVAHNAMKHSKNPWINVAQFLLAFWFSLFAFALGYYQFGLFEVADISAMEAASIVSEVETFRVQYPEEFNEQVRSGRIFLGPLELEVSDYGFRLAPQMASSRWDYFYYSLSSALGDKALTKLEACPSASFLLYFQNAVNAGFALLSIFIVVRLQPKD